MRHGDANKKTKRASTKSDGQEAFVAAQVGVEVSPLDASGSSGKASLEAPQQRSAVSGHRRRDGFEDGQQMEMRLPKVKRTYGRVLWAVWATLAVWMACLRTAPTAQVSATLKEKKGERQEQWQGQRSRGTSKGAGWYYDTKASEDHRAQFPGVQETLYVQETHEEKTYTPDKTENEVAPMPAASGIPAQVLMALLKDVAEGKSSAEDALKQANKTAAMSSTTTGPTDSKDVHKVGRQLAKAQAKTKKAYETLKKMKEEWAAWTGQMQELYNRKVKQYEEAHKAWTLVLQDALNAEKTAKTELQALGKNHQQFKWEDIELDDKELPDVFIAGADMEVDSTELRGELPPGEPRQSLSAKLEEAATARVQKKEEKEQEKEKERAAEKKRKQEQRKADTASEASGAGAKKKGNTSAEALKQGRLPFTPQQNKFAPLDQGEE